MRGHRKYLIVMGLALALAIYAEATAPKPIDWTPSYSRLHARPYGALAVYELFVETMEEATVQVTDMPIYNTLDERTATGSETYLIVNDRFSPDELDLETLLAFADDGNTVFVAANALGGPLLDSLGLETDDRMLDVDEGLDAFFRRDTVTMNFVNPSIRAPRSYRMRVGRNERWFGSFDTARATVLGVDERDRPNYVRIERGAGAVYVHSVATVFTNFNVLMDDNAAYVFTAFSYLPTQPTFWDEYYKDGRVENDSPLRAVMRNVSLRWTWMLGLVGVLLFVLVYGRRRQRAIPIVRPPANTTLEFTETLGRLYHQHGDHRAIAQKKAAYFREYLRTHLDIRPGEHEHDLHRRVAERSGVSEDRIASIFGRILFVDRASDFDEEDLKALNADLEDFYTNSRR